MSKRAVPVSEISVDSCRDPGNRARQSGAEHHTFPYDEQPISVGGMKSFQQRMCGITCWRYFKNSSTSSTRESVVIQKFLLYRSSDATPFQNVYRHKSVRPG